MSEFTSDTLLSHPSALRGRALSDRYALQDVLGVGGMATVFRAWDQLLGRSVAVKILHPQYVADCGFLARFRREAEMAAGVSGHPNIVSIYDFGQDEDLPYIVMELVEGRTLKEIVRERSPLSLEEAIPIAQQVAAALHFAHER